MFYKLKADDRTSAIRYGKKLCRCKRSSFDGIKWFNKLAGEWEEITWLEVDSQRTSKVVG